MNQMRPCNPFNNVVASGTANCDLNSLLGTTVESLNLTLGGGSFTKAMITGIQLKANNKVIFETDGSKLDAGETFKNYFVAADATRLSIDLMERKGRTVNTFQTGALDLSKGSGINNLRMEVTIAGATTPTLVCNAIVSPALATPGEEQIRFLFHRRHRVVQTIGAGGLYVPLVIPHLEPAGGGSAYKRVMIFSANLTAIRLVRDGQADFDISKADMQYQQLKDGRLPQANLTVLDFILDNLQQGRLYDTRPVAGVQSAIFYGLFSAGETITTETEELLPFGAY